MARSVYKDTVPVRLAVANGGYVDLDMEATFYVDRGDDDDEVAISIKSLSLDINTPSVYDDASSYIEDEYHKYLGRIRGGP